MDQVLISLDAYKNTCPWFYYDATVQEYSHCDNVLDHSHAMHMDTSTETVIPYYRYNATPHHACGAVEEIMGRRVYTMMSSVFGLHHQMNTGIF